MKKLIYLIIFLVFFIFFSCKKSQEPISIDVVYNKIQNNDIVDKYYDYKIGPVLRGIDRIHIFFPDSTNKYYRNFDVNSPDKLTEVLYYNFIDQKYYELFYDTLSKEEKVKIHSILLGLYKNNIIAVRKDYKYGFMYIYTTIIDTVCEDKKYKYVFIYDINNNL